ncbi:MAG: hypothetical protein KAH23_04950, partial [Kiritimatiellae bacterium]|nr:hypothetical protein [Kiritimatiellia bacterium]
LRIFRLIANVLPESLRKDRVHMNTAVVSALIGVSGVIVGALLSEFLRMFHDIRASQRERRKLSGHLVATYYELGHNRLLASDLNKLEIRTYSHEAGIVRSSMVECLRQHYDCLPSDLIRALENAYARLWDITHLVDTGPSGEHKRWSETGEKVVVAIDNALHVLQAELRKRGIPALE